MAEYYPLLAKAVASLPNSTLESRKVVYERARKALIGQLRMLHPPVPDDDIERESIALDAAVARLEGELTAAADAPTSEPPAAVPGAVTPLPLPETPAARFPPAGGALGPSATKPFPVLRAKAPLPRAPAERVEPAAVGSSSPDAAAAPMKDPAPWPRDPAAAAALPPFEAGDVERRSRPRPDQQRPIAPQPPEPKRTKRPLWIIPLGIGVVVAGVAVAAYKLRDRPEVLRPRTAEQAQAPTDAGKSVDRVGNSAAAVVAEAPRTTNGVAEPVGPSAGTNAGNPAAPVAGRAALLVEAPDEKDKFKTYIGAVVWRLDNVSDGQNQSVGLAVRADIDLPDDKMKATVVFQKNMETSLPASHTIKIRFSVQPGSPSGSIKEINVPQMRREDSAAGEPLDGVTVAIVENSFLVGLSPGNSESANLEMLRSREWIDIPIRLTSGKIAKLTFEKTAAGQRDLQEAVTAWSKS